MSTFNAGSIEASLTLGRTSWVEDLKKTQEEIDRLEQTTITVGIDADDTNARIAMDNIELLLDDLGQQTYTPEIDLNIDPAKEKLAELQGILDGLASQSVTITVDADIDNFLVGADTVESIGESMSKDPIEIQVDMDSTAFHRGAAEVELVADVLSANTIGIGVETTGVPKVLAELAELETAIEIVDHNDIDVRVNYDKNTLGNLIGSGAGAGATGGGQLGILELAMILIIGLAPILGVAIGAATAAIIGFVAALVAALGPVLVLAGGLLYLYHQYSLAKKAGDEMVGPMKEFADAIDHFKHVFNTLPDFSKEGFGLLADGINLASKILPTFVPLFKLAAGVITDLIGSISDWVDSPSYNSFIGFFEGFGIDMLKRFIQIIGNLLKFFGNLFIAFEPFARVMMRGLAGVTASWAEWSAGLEHNKGFQHFIDNAMHYGPLVLHMFGELWRALMNIAHSLEPFAGPMLAGLTNFFTFIADMDPTVLGHFVLLFSALFVALKVIVPAVSTLVGGIEALATGAGILAEALGISIGVLFIWVIAIAAVAAMIIYLWNTNETFRNAIISTWNDIKKAVMPIITDISSLIQDNWGSIVEWASGVWTDFQAIIVQAMIIIHQVIFFTTQLIMFIWKHFGDQILTIIKNTASALGQIVRGVFQLLRGIFTLIADVLTGKWSHLWDDLKLIAKGFWNIVVGLFKLGMSQLNGIMSLIKHALGLIWAAMWSNLKQAAASGWGWIKDRFNDFIGWLRGIGGRVAGAVHGIWDGILNEFRNVLNTIVGWWNGLSLSVDIPNKIPGLPDSFTVSTPDVPGFADGAWVDKPTLAMIGEGSEPEIVSPESKMRKIFAEANHFDYGKMAHALSAALAPMFGSLLTPELVERLLREAGPKVAVDASDDNRSAHALAHEMAFQLRVLGYGGAG